MYHGQVVALDSDNRSRNIFNILVWLTVLDSEDKLASVGSHLVPEVDCWGDPVDGLVLVNDVALLDTTLETASLLVEGGVLEVGQTPASHAANLSPPVGGALAAARLPEAEAIGAAFGVAVFKEEGAKLAMSTHFTLNVRLAETASISLVTDVLGGATRVTVALRASWEAIMTNTAHITAAIGDVCFAPALPSGSVTVKVTTDHSHGITVAVLAANQSVKAERPWQTRVTPRPCDARRTYAAAIYGVTQSTGATTRLTAGEAVVSRATLGTCSANHVGLAVALSSEHVTVEAGRPVNVALTLEHSVVVFTRQGEDSVTTETLLGQADVVIVLATLLDKVH